MKELLGPGVDGEDTCHEMWHNGVMEGQCPSERITYSDFLRIMKGQSSTGTDTTSGSSRNDRRSRRRSSTSARRLLESNALERVGHSASLVMTRRGVSTSSAVVPTTPVPKPIKEDDRGTTL
jgi:hypothetical protein